MDLSHHDKTSTAKVNLEYVKWKWLGEWNVIYNN